MEEGGGRREDDLCPFANCFSHFTTFGPGSMVVEMVPLKGGIGSIFHPPEGKDYKWYISGIFPANWGMDYATDPTLYGNQHPNHWLDSSTCLFVSDSAWPPWNPLRDTPGCLKFICDFKYVCFPRKCHVPKCQLNPTPVYIQESRIRMN